MNRFISYFYQVDLVSSLVSAGDSKILEIGVGNAFVSDYLKKIGYNVVTCDFDERLKPDIVADIRDLNLGENSYSVVTAFEILEHIPYEDFEKTLNNLKKISYKFVVISLPYRSTSVEFVLKIPFIRTLFNNDFLVFFLRFPWFFKGFASSGQHYWEIDGYKYRLSKVLKILKNNFKSVKKIRPVLDGYRLFFILEK